MYSQLTQSAFAFSYDVFIPDFLMAGLAVKPGSEQKTECQPKVSEALYANLLTSSADWAMKNPTVLGAILKSLGFIQILLSFPSSPSPVFSSMARRRSFSLTKQIL